MKIRSVKITNFRKFVGTHGVDGISDGVNVLVGRNELGKSTLLAAINGVIFEKAKSKTSIVESFRHYITNNVPEVELTFDLHDKRWTIRKRFAYQSGKAVLTNSDNLRFEDEAAETQLQKLFDIASRRGGSEPGIWGTLWVGQGRSFGAPELSETGITTLQGCIETQVGLVTGGERGRTIPLAVEEELRQIMSARGPSGKYKDVLDSFEMVHANVITLDQKRNQIFAQMDSLSRHKRELKSLQADWNEEDYLHELEETRILREAAVTKAHVIDAARKEATNADGRATRAKQAVEDRAKLVSEAEAIEAKIKALNNEREKARKAAVESQAKVDATQKELSGLRERLRSHGEQTRRLDRIRTAVALQSEIDKHEATLEKAALLQTESGRLAELIGQIKATDDSLSQIEAAEASLTGATAALNSVATTLSLEIETDALERVRRDGAPLDGTATSHSVVTRTRIDIEGIGMISIEPQIHDRDAMLSRLQTAKDELLSALETAGTVDIGAARLAVAQRHELERSLAELLREIAGIAPKEISPKLAAGLEPRRSRIALLRGQLKTEFEILDISGLPTIEEIQQRISEAHRIAEQLDAEIELAQTATAVPTASLSETNAVLSTLELRMAALRANLETNQVTLIAGRSQSSDEDLSVQAMELQRGAEVAKTVLKSMEIDPGETVAAINARIKRLESAGKNHSDDVNRLNNEIAGLNAWIKANEGEGVEEALETARAEQSRLENAIRGYEEDVQVLQLLQQTLRDAESEAKSLYLAPVISRVEPYLRMLLPGADLLLDGNLGISAIKRNGADEAFERLSGGTQEQLAILTRLAFAELLLTKGRPATVILDDAMAFSDDERIERMFDILKLAGDKVQILVLTCRKKLFSRLGADELSFREIPN